MMSTLRDHGYVVLCTVRTACGAFSIVLDRTFLDPTQYHGDWIDRFSRSPFDARRRCSAGSRRWCPSSSAHAPEGVPLGLVMSGSPMRTHFGRTASRRCGGPCPLYRSPGAGAGPQQQQDAR